MPYTLVGIYGNKQWEFTGINSFRYIDTPDTTKILSRCLRNWEEGRFLPSIKRKRIYTHPESQYIILFVLPRLYYETLRVPIFFVLQRRTGRKSSDREPVGGMRRLRVRRTSPTATTDRLTGTTRKSDISRSCQSAHSLTQKSITVGVGNEEGRYWGLYHLVPVR